MVDGEQEIKMVTTGLSNDQFTQVKDGLKEGDLVVVPGSATTMPDLLEGRGFGGVMPGIPGGVRPIR